jgi:hypothetical protein
VPKLGRGTLSLSLSSRRSVITALSPADNTQPSPSSTCNCPRCQLRLTPQHARRATARPLPPPVSRTLPRPRGAPPACRPVARGQPRPSRYQSNHHLGYVQCEFLKLYIRVVCTGRMKFSFLVWELEISFLIRI